MFVDSHAHIDGDHFDGDRDQVVERALERGVTHILNVGTGDPNNAEIERGVQLAAKYDCVFAAAGVHPHDASGYSDRTEEYLENSYTTNGRMLAIGEIGLDFHYDHSPRDVQIKVFQRQLELAKRLDSRVIIHSRSADSETVDILRWAELRPERPGVMHCFSGGAEMAESVLDLGFMISFSGNVTFKSAQPLRDIAHRTPMERILIETDCPFLTPVPFRGRRNEPMHVVEVARCIAEVKGLSLEQVGIATTENFLRTFELDV